MITRLKMRSIPVSVKASGDLVDLVLVRGKDSIVARICEVRRLPIERLDESKRVVNDHRFLMRQIKSGVTCRNLDSGIRQRNPRIIILLASITARRIEHDTHVDTAPPRIHHGSHEGGVRENEHLDAERLPGIRNGTEDGLG